MKVRFDYNALKLRIKSVVEGLEIVVDQALKDASERGAQIARDKAEYISHGNNGLKANTQAFRSSALEHGILAKKRYAQWVEYGNGPEGSRIYPRRSSCLHFFINGKEIFAKSVKASKPRPYMSKAVKFEEENLNKIVAQHIKHKIYLK